MLRTILGAVAGVIIWHVAVFAISFCIAALAPDFGAALKAHADTAAQAARLGISAMASLVAGFTAAKIGRESFRAPLAASIVLLALYVPYHLSIWTQFPLWYHLTFFVSLPVLSVAGGRLSK